VARQARNEPLIVIALQQLAQLAGAWRRRTLRRAVARLRGRAIHRAGNPARSHGAMGLRQAHGRALRETLSGDEIAQLAADGAAWWEDQAIEEAQAV
jgi:hypothetical protein